jgi:hypothetical protein
LSRSHYLPPELCRAQLPHLPPRATHGTSARSRQRRRRGGGGGAEAGRHVGWRSGAVAATGVVDAAALTAVGCTPGAAAAGPERRDDGDRGELCRPPWRPPWRPRTLVHPPWRIRCARTWSACLAWGLRLCGRVAPAGQLLRAAAAARCCRRRRRRCSAVVIESPWSQLISDCQRF